MSNTRISLRIPTTEYRALPIPTGNGTRAKLATCFVKVSDLPTGLESWMSVNPRVPKFTKKDKLRGPVGRAMVRTLTEEPEKFAIKNQGIYILCDSVSFVKEEGGDGTVTIELSDPEIHGLVNGGHTYHAIREAEGELAEDGPPKAHVRLHLMEGIDSDDIMDLAQGLNRSMQVDDPSLENLRGTFEKIKAQLHGKPGADQIAYRQGDLGEVDILQVLHLMCLSNLDDFPDRKRYPNILFGHPKTVLQLFVEDQDKGGKVFDRLVPHVHEILVLSDRVQQQLAAGLGRARVEKKVKENRVGSRKNKMLPAHFAGGQLGGKIPLGWLYPAMGALRANLSSASWKKGTFKWIMDPVKLLEEVAPEMAEIILQEHQDQKGKPAEVGKKEAAYRGCYGVVTVALAQRGLLETS